jgi:uncharacterized protein YutE (UPF0331/DUF86 family)
MNLVAAAKITSLQRCVARAREAHARAGAEFHRNRDLQDAAVLNIIRACETAIDLATMAIRARQLGLPTESREFFATLERESILPSELGARLRAMVGFRNLAVHQYRDIDLDIVERIILKDLDDLLSFGQTVGRLLGAIDEAKP